MSKYLDTNLGLLIMQYSNSPKAIAELTSMFESYENVYNVFNNFVPEFDLDNAYGDRLDKLGKILGLGRLQYVSVDRTYFGFNHNTDTQGFGMSPFLDKDDGGLTLQNLTDREYVFYLKAKLGFNLSKSTAVSINDTIYSSFEGRAVLIDNKDMTARLLLESESLLPLFTTLLKMKIFPLPQAVGIKDVLISPVDVFGFSHNPSAKGFGQAPFASKVNLN